MISYASALALSVSCAVSLTGCIESSATPHAETAADNSPSPRLASTEIPAGTTFEDVLAEFQAYNQRLSRVAAPLKLENAALCPRTQRDPGFTIHRLEDYPPRVQPIAEVLLGLKAEGLFVRSVRPNTSAARARVAPGDQIIKVNENTISTSPRMERYNRAVLQNGFESVLSKVTIRTAEGQDYVARIWPETACDIPASVIFSNNINGHTDGREILITSALMQSVPDDTNLALILAHEMGHVIAGHADQTPSQALELEADRMALVLLARAGYDIDAAVAYWETNEHPHEGGSKTESSHPSTQARYENFRDELARIKQVSDVATLTF